MPWSVRSVPVPPSRKQGLLGHQVASATTWSALASIATGCCFSVPSPFSDRSCTARSPPCAFHSMSAVKFAFPVNAGTLAVMVALASTGIRTPGA